MRRAFGQAIVGLAATDPALFLLHGDVEQEMAAYRAQFPGRILNLGTCEQAIISLAAGMATQGLRPIVYSLTPFVLERPFEQIKIDLDEQDLPVLLVGYSGYPAHGPTHRPLNPRKLCECFKNIVSYFPTTPAEASVALHAAYHCGHPAFVSLTRVS